MTNKGKAINLYFQELILEQSEKSKNKVCLPIAENKEGNGNK